MSMDELEVSEWLGVAGEYNDAVAEQQKQQK